MAEENIHQLIERRERELMAQISAIRGQLGPKEAELAQIQRMKTSLTIAGGNVSNPLEAAIGGPGPIDWNAIAALPSPNSPIESPYTAPLARFLDSERSYQAMTIKELTVQALLDHFPNGGTSADIRDFIRDAYRRTIEPSSLRPQMHRLKAAGSLEHDASTDTWNLTARARMLYSRYDHPTSRKGMLQDDPIDDTLPEPAAKLPWSKGDDKS